MSVLKMLALKASSLEFSQIPADVIRESRYCLLDALGCGLHGSTLSEGNAIASALSRVNGSGSVPVWGTKMFLAEDTCAMACGSFCHLRELDDVHYSIVHPGAVCVPAGVAVAHANNQTLKDLLVAIIIGYEIMVRIAKGINYLNHRRLGWHATATCGPFGAAAVTAKLLGFTDNHLLWALGI